MSSKTPSSEAKRPKKSILKKPTTNFPSTDATAPPISPLPVKEHTPNSDPKPTAREAAIQQARIIQQQFELEDRIQDTIIELARFPLTPPSGKTYTASTPHPNDTSSFLHLVSLLQPGDYEDLIEERNTLNKCGYALCPNPRLKLGKGGEFKLINFGRKDFGIVPRKELERWCDRSCARRAMYVKVQLAEVAAAVRAGLPAAPVELYEEPGSTTNGKGDKEMEEQRKAAQDAKDLALERGDAKDGKPSGGGQVTVTIREKPVAQNVQEPSLAEDGEGHLVLDGYKQRFDPKTQTTRRMTSEEISTMAATAFDDLFG
ncbi:uncharacterized protein F4822DRAFT_311438 [Hypoxylon trugodes]|uniref:uncharacterized protein n=1 Tax=Hypoxylon trugodes TaxID=326681 RepID=UPI00219AE117|nr:uncharacterized protein F4822DRAFT_311438 [Hypoxylon trugodes]KAI1386294.1 hypothetical protein F4822DRAFT_311438 [Hypoxylon trugodes]